MRRMERGGAANLHLLLTTLLPFADPLVLAHRHLAAAAAAAALGPDRLRARVGSGGVAGSLAAPGLGMSMVFPRRGRAVCIYIAEAL